MLDRKDEIEWLTDRIMKLLSELYEFDEDETREQFKRIKSFMNKVAKDCRSPKKRQEDS